MGSIDCTDFAYVSYVRHTDRRTDVIWPVCDHCRCPLVPLAGKSVPSCQPANKAKLIGRLMHVCHALAVVRATDFNETVSEWSRSHCEDLTFLVGAYIRGLQRQTADGMAEYVCSYYPFSVSVAIGWSVVSIPMKCR